MLGTRADDVHSARAVSRSALRRCAGRVPVFPGWRPSRQSSARALPTLQTRLDRNRRQAQGVAKRVSRRVRTAPCGFRAGAGLSVGAVGPDLTLTGHAALTTHADPLYQHLIVTAERKFWRCVENGEPPRLFGVEPPKPRIEAVRIVDMSGSNSWAEFAGLFRNTRQAFLDHERSKTELKALMPEDAKEAIGHGVRGKRSKSGAVSFDLLDVEASHAAIQ
jgi:hypothetical protein